MGYYASTSWDQAAVDLGARLSDPGEVRWTKPEKLIYLQEALRTFNALTGHFRDQATFNTVENRPFYDLSTVIPKQCGYAVHDSDLITVLQYHLLEPVNPLVWAGSDQFTLEDVVTAIQRRRDQFLLETGIVVRRNLYPIQPPPDGRIVLDQAIATVRRVAWITSDDVVTPLLRDDLWSLTHYTPAWVQDPNRPPEEPSVYSVGETPPLVLQVAPPPQDTGAIDIVAVTRGPVLTPGLVTLLGMPDDWTWVVKFGALADLLLKDGLAADPSRAQYCESRWQQGLEAAKTTSTVWGARVNNVVIPITSLSEADTFMASWQSPPHGPPSQAMLAGGNLMAFTPVPDLPGMDLNYSVTVDVVARAPMPGTTNEPIQVGPELYDGILNYALHLALVKEGTASITDSKPLLDGFLRLAGVRVALDVAEMPNQSSLTGQTAQDEAMTPRMVVNG